MIGEEGTRLGAAAARRLAASGRFAIGPGLTDAEFAEIEDAYGFEFGDDHRAFLAAGVPVNGTPRQGQMWERPWPEWRGGDPAELRKRLERPVEGVLFDVENNDFWYEAWGERPAADEAALERARLCLRDVPVLVPVYSHRYLPAGRGTSGHPVLSVWQTDIIYYGLDLDDYLHQEFGNGRGHTDASWDPRATVPFWRDLL
ncbi:hypothetical protein [Streptomyces aureus]|uniref:hypothetical protein n=1 Tax=Streptomyces aureus TaxID=193461 RepID=UPI0033C47D6A